ncbi:hypothetical protein [Paenibacillus popilliae]|uniref:Ketopantoate hydroxymethyltransferase n=1 Tax=Paenibacillus popilliae ATCC 14706 TaxID=1212764 RepID=M9LP78_PAEPP|nr:hypothetical protein [Paenibacillus popilliae]GAC42266.1 ketopantoate hydroxymethyltransferase [Paenibacillus popilliae ATCC 14706]
MIITKFLNEVANYTDTRAVKVVLNGTYEITKFIVKQVDGSLMILNYLVPAADISSITKIEIKDVSNNVISLNDVDIPVTTDHMMVHTIEVKEG